MRCKADLSQMPQVRPTPLIEQLIAWADVVFLSKDFARKHGCTDAHSALHLVAANFARNGAVLVDCSL